MQTKKNVCVGEQGGKKLNWNEKTDMEKMVQEELDLESMELEKEEVQLNAEQELLEMENIELGDTAEEDVTTGNTSMSKQERDKKFTDLFRKYKGLMFWTAKDVLNEEYSAEDAVQDAFLRIIGRIDQIEDIHSAETKRYVSLAARNAAIDRYRKRIWNADKEIFAEDVDYLEEIEAEPCLEDTEGNRILDIINAMPDTYREVCFMKYVEKMENWEIAEKLHMREGTVRQKLARGKVWIEKAIRELEQEGAERIL